MTIIPDTLAGRLSVVSAGVTDAATEAGRDPNGITTIVVSKFHPASMVRELYGLGVRDFGENRHQDAAPKALALADLAPTWHFVGQLQGKKAKAVLAYSRVIHSVDRVSLVDALDRAETDVDVFLQINLTDDPARGGAQLPDLEAIAERVVASARLRLKGLMAVAPLGVEPRAAFARVRHAAARVTAIDSGATALSMGMSADYREAILEGATHLQNWYRNHGQSTRTRLISD